MMRTSSWRRPFLLMLSLCLLTRGAGAQATEEASKKENRKPAWQWTIEERLAKRFDPADVKARAAAESKRLQDLKALGMPSLELATPDSANPTIDGRKNPELFLPSELFNVLLVQAFPPDGRLAQSRASMEERAAALGLGADLWNRLGKAAAPYLALSRERDRLALAHQAGAPANERLSGALSPEALCRARAEALSAAKAEFGEATFLRLLYEAVAPFITLGSGSADPAAAENLRRIERGCR